MDSKEQPLVAIGLPTRNREKYLPSAVDSLLGQTYRNILLIISDNASTDSSVKKICENYAAKDKRVRYIRQPQNLGQAGNATFCLQQMTAAADFCMLAEDDDIWEKRFVEACMEKLVVDPEAVEAFPRSGLMLWRDKSKTERDPKLFFPFDKDKYTRLKKFILTYSVDNRGVPIYGVWRKRAIVGERFRPDYYEDDISFVFRALSRGYFIFVDEGPLFFAGRLPNAELYTERLVPQSITLSRLLRSFTNRLSRSRTEFDNMAFILKIEDLSPWQRIKLVMWNLLVVGRLFVMHKT